MLYEVIGVYSKETGANCSLKLEKSYKKAAGVIQEYAGNPMFQGGFYILERPRKHSFPYAYTLFKNDGTSYRSGIMAKTLKLAFWQSQSEYEQFI